MSQLKRFLLFVLGILALVAYSELGKWVAPLLPITIPPSLVGMLLLLLTLRLRGSIPSFLESAAKPILSHMSLLFVPAIIGIWHYRDIISDNKFTLFVAVILTTVVAFAFTAWLAEKMQDKAD